MTFEAAVDELVGKGFSREMAERAAREQLGLTPTFSAGPSRSEAVLEKDEQAEIVKLFRAYRLRVYTTSQYRPAKVTPGIPDLWCVHETEPIAFWWESKRQIGGELSSTQADFRDECQRCKVGWGSGDRYTAAAYLVGLGLAEDQGNGKIEPTRRSA